MLTDIFADRYANATITYSSYQSATRFLVQASRMITDQIYPLYNGDADNSENSKILKKIHSDLSLELGLDQLTSPTDYSGLLSIWSQTANYFKPTFADEDEFDGFLKERLSFIELAFRNFEDTTKSRNSKLMDSHISLSQDAKLMRLGETMGIPLLQEGYAISQIHLNSENLKQNLDELRERIRKAGLPLTYSDRYLQISDDALLEEHVKQPFWKAISEPKWSNVATDMHEAIDRRDNGRAEAALSAAKALESAIKIIAHDREATTGKERGAINFIEALASVRRGQIIETWEANVLKNFFSEVRNKLGHGPGMAEATVLTRQQDDWAIETCMSWIKSLINRL